jgi:lipopolysaccharide export system protein LptC
VIEMRNIRAKMEMQDKSTVELSAATGIYDSKGETIKLDQNIVITSSTGYRGLLSQAMVDIGTGHVVSEQPVLVEMLQGTLNANRLEIVDSGDLMQFGGGVRMVTMLNQADALPTGHNPAAQNRPTTR